ncbi:hypothetical protein ACFVTC_11365 [Streptomyces sp. NPDC057950]|uniref:hypothetical protein n=1 Tax=Streptomyces sp. NPDC057950 TaxID=3346288 RepID=UPI0036E25192
MSDRHLAQERGGWPISEPPAGHDALITPHAARRTPHAARRTPHAARRTPHAALAELITAQHGSVPTAPVNPAPPVRGWAGLYSSSSSMGCGARL